MGRNLKDVPTFVRTTIALCASEDSQRRWMAVSPPDQDEASEANQRPTRAVVLTAVRKAFGLIRVSEGRGRDRKGNAERDARISPEVQRARIEDARARQSCSTRTKRSTPSGGSDLERARRILDEVEAEEAQVAVATTSVGRSTPGGNDRLSLRAFPARLGRRVRIPFSFAHRFSGLPGFLDFGPNRACQDGIVDLHHHGEAVADAVE